MSKKISTSNIFLVILILVLGCQEEPEAWLNFPHIITLDVTDISEAGVTFHAEIENNGNIEIINHGFIWGLYESLIHHDSISIGSTNDLKISKNIDFGLPKNQQVYFKSFLQTNDFIVYGNAKKFESKGSKPPVFTAIEPQNGLDGDTILISGNNFSSILTSYEILFGEYTGRIISANKNRLLVTVPENYKNPGSVKIKIKLFETWYDVGDFYLDTSKAGSAIYKESSVKGNKMKFLQEAMFGEAYIHGKVNNLILQNNFTKQDIKHLS